MSGYILKITTSSNFSLNDVNKFVKELKFLNNISEFKPRRSVRSHAEAEQVEDLRWMKSVRQGMKLKYASVLYNWSLRKHLGYVCYIK